MTYEELLLTPEYYTAEVQIELYNRVETYLKENKLTRTELAKQLGVSKGYVSQILNGDYDHRLSKLMELSLAIGYKPRIVFEPIKSNKLETCDKIEKTISEVQESLRQIGYSAMCFKPKNTLLSR